MKFRFYLLLYVAAVVLLVVALFQNVACLIEHNGAEAWIDNFKYVAVDGAVSYSVFPMAVVLIVAVAVNLFASFVSLFSNFVLQKRCSVLSVLLLSGYYILLLVYSLILTGDAAVEMHPAFFMPLIALVMNVAAFMLARREEARIISRSLGFRLRD